MSGTSMFSMDMHLCNSNCKFSNQIKSNPIISNLFPDLQGKQHRKKQYKQFTKIHGEYIGGSPAKF